MTNTKQKHLVIAAAGTGGHVMPGLAVAKVMRERGWSVSWIGTTTGMEAELVARHEIPFSGLNFQGVRGKGLLGAVKGGMKLLGALGAARSVLGREKPDVVFSTGGYVAVPVGWAAKSLGRPPVLINLVVGGSPDVHEHADARLHFACVRLFGRCPLLCG